MRWRKKREPIDDPADESEVHPTAAVLSELQATVAAAKQAGDVAALTGAIDEFERVLRPMAADDFYRGIGLHILGEALGFRYRLAGDPDDLRSAVKRGGQAAATTAPDDPQRFIMLAVLASHCRQLFKVTGRRADIDAAIKWGSESLDLAPADDQFKAEKFHNLAVAHQLRFELTGAVKDQDTMAALYEKSLTAAGNERVDHPAVLSTMRNAAMDKFVRTGQPELLDRAIEWGERALEDDDPAVVSSQSFLLAYIYNERYDLANSLADAEATIRHAEVALAGTHPDAEDRASVLFLVAEGYRRRSDQVGSRADVETGIERLEQAVAAARTDDPQRARFLSNLCVDYTWLFELTGDPEALATAIDRGEQAAAATRVSDPDHLQILGHLSTAYSAKYGLSADPDDLEAAIAMNQRLVASPAVRSQARAAALANLATLYFDRHARFGAAADLDAGITAGAEALELLPATGPDRSAGLSNLAVGRRRRYDLFGAVADLDAAIELGEQAAQALPADHPHRPSRLTNLAVAYAERFQRVRNSADLDTAIEHSEQAVAAGRPLKHDELGMAFGNLSGYYLERFDIGGQVSDLEAGVERAEQAVAAVGADHPRWAGYCSALARALLDRYRYAGDAADLDDSIDLLEAALAATPVERPARGGLVANLAITYREMAKRWPLPDGALGELIEAVSQPSSDSPVDEAARYTNVGMLAMETGAMPAAAAMFRAAVELLPRCAPRGLDWSDQVHQLSGSRGLMGRAVATHLAIGDVAGAVELAELGRGILVSDELDARADLTELARSAPELAEDFTRIRERLDQQGPAESDTTQVTAWLLQRRELADQWDRLIGQIRELPGFADFLARPQIGDLQQAAAAGAIVLVNSGEAGRDAVLLRPGSVEHVPLDRLRPADVEAQLGRLLGVERQGDELVGVAPTGATHDLLGWLWETVTEPVLTALGHAGPPADGDVLPRVWWVPIGTLGLLPLHAAGLPGGTSALDCVVSSYTPTVRTLIQARQKQPSGRRTRLSVAMRRTPGLHDLPGTVAEVNHLRRRYPGSAGLSDAGATIGSVLDALPRADWAHFACHAASHPTEPSRSGLYLHDAVLSVPAISRLRLRTGELAYLSACSTGQGSIVHADEVLHLASAFQLAGYRHVVATQWVVDDAIAARASRRFYDLLGDSASADPAAVILNEVTRELRDQYPGQPHLWAPFVHSGP
ncbi:CHAT domain-containing protein [Kribbella sp. VKM Ac-2527]|uniref:CHAT domain-containing protein n=1 Tax=Kribbella caucasensis TaxID=2512215 RepID=A0A4R6KEY9_9ACTN|nr:CHAT domain-containing protein [Kribbella sp. VKM Ac-2527]TDO48605.1 CHAT domain-containing protein [Kribbella sp. VKM Ac-2527]